MSKYLTFPVAIFKNSNLDTKRVTEDILAYCLYDNCQKSGQPFTKDLIESETKWMGIKFPDLTAAYEKGYELYHSLPQGSPKASVTNTVIKDFHQHPKTEFESICFLAFAASRSILQKQSVIKLPNRYLVARMAGHSGISEPLPGWIEKYDNRYQLGKIKQELQHNWGLKLYAHHTRGSFISFKMTLEELIMYAEGKRRKTKEKQLRKQKEEIRQRVLKSQNTNST